MQAVFGQMFFETLPDALGFLAIRHHTMRLIGKQGQLLAFGQQELWLLLQEETVEHGCQQTIDGIIEHIDCHRLFLKLQ